MSDPSSRAWLKPFMEPLKPVFREVLAMSLFVNLLALAVPVFTLQVYDRVIASAGISTLWGLAIGMIFVIIFDYILRMARSRIMQSVALRVDVLVGQRLFDKLMALIEEDCIPAAQVKLKGPARVAIEIGFVQKPEIETELSDDAFTHPQSQR